MPLLFLFDNGGSLSIPSPAKAYSFLGPNLPTGVTLTRGSAATFVNNKGLLSQVGANVPRFEFNGSTPLGLMIEPQSTNLLTQSQTYTDATEWSAFSNTVAGNVVNAPDNTATGSTITTIGPVGGVTTQNPAVSQTVSLTSGTTYTFSNFFQANFGDQFVVLELNDGSTGFETVVYNLATGAYTSDTNVAAVESSKSIVPLANNWQRLAVTTTPGFNATGATFDFYQSSVPGTEIVGANPNTLKCSNTLNSFLYELFNGVAVADNHDGTWTFTYPAAGAAFTTRPQTGIILPSTSYVFSFNAKSGTLGTIAADYFDGAAATFGPNITLSTTLTRYSFAFTTGTTVGTGANVAINNFPTSGAGTVIVNDLQLEKVATGVVAPTSYLGDTTCPPPPAPIAGNITARVAPNTTNDVVVPVNTGGPFTSITINSNPSHGTATGGSVNNILYTPTTSFTGTDSFTYSLVGLGGTSASATATITVQAGGRNFILGIGANHGESPSFRARLGFPPEYTVDNSFEDPFGFGGVAALYGNADNGYPVMISVSLGPQGVEPFFGGRGVTDYAGAAAGNYNGNYQQVVNDIKNSAQASSVIAVRIDPEFSFALPDPNLFKAAWNNCAQIWKATMPGVKTIWNPNWQHNVTNYFPGTQFCNIIGIDNYYNPTYDGPTSITAYNLHLGNSSTPGTLAWYVNQSKTVWGNLPLCFPEWGDFYINNTQSASNNVGFGPNPTQGIIAFLNWMNDPNNNVVAATYWNEANVPGVINEIGWTAINSVLQGNPYTGSFWTSLPAVTNYPTLNP